MINRSQRKLTIILKKRKIQKGEKINKKEKERKEGWRRGSKVGVMRKATREITNKNLKGKKAEREEKNSSFSFHPRPPKPLSILFNKSLSCGKVLQTGN